MPIGLIIIMAGMGMTLDLAAFKRVFTVPLPIVAGLSAQMLLLPLVALGLVLLFDVDSMIGLGLILLSASPGGVTSNALTYVVKADVALSISLTAINSLLISVTLPVVLLIGARMIDASLSTDIDLPFSRMIGQLLGVTVFPIATGMLLRKFLPNFAHQSEPFIRVFSVVLLALMLIILWFTEYQLFLGNARQVGLLIFCLLMITMGLGYGLAGALSLPEPQRFTILLEVGIQNTVLSVYVAANILEDKALAVVPSTYGMLMMLPVAALMLGRHWKLTRPAS
ncbi:MAG: hypothetical protein OXC05_00165 [Halieaceae bacterium]|nr:hypothetical protein [Halieaceae bacterium]